MLVKGDTKELTNSLEEELNSSSLISVTQLGLGWVGPGSVGLEWGGGGMGYGWGGGRAKVGMGQGRGSSFQILLSQWGWVTADIQVLRASETVENAELPRPPA